MNKTYEKLTLLQAEAEILYTLGEKGVNDSLVAKSAMERYKLLKTSIRELLITANEEWDSKVPPWYITSYQSALRNAYLSLACYTNTSPKNSRWLPCVSLAHSELSIVIQELHAALKSHAAYSKQTR